MSDSSSVLLILTRLRHSSVRVNLQEQFHLFPLHELMRTCPWLCIHTTPLVALAKCTIWGAILPTALVGGASTVSPCGLSLSVCLHFTNDGWSGDTANYVGRPGTKKTDLLVRLHVQTNPGPGKCKCGLLLPHFSSSHHCSIRHFPTRPQAYMSRAGFSCHTKYAPRGSKPCLQGCYSGSGSLPR